MVVDWTQAQHTPDIAWEIHQHYFVAQICGLPGVIFTNCYEILHTQTVSQRHLQINNEHD